MWTEGTVVRWNGPTGTPGGQERGWGIEMAASPAQRAPDASVSVGANAGMVYGLIIALAVLIAAPRIKLRSRLLSAAGCPLGGLLCPFGGLLRLGHRLHSVADTVRSGSDGGVLSGTFQALTLVWLVVPSLVWFPVLLLSWGVQRPGNA